MFSNATAAEAADRLDRIVGEIVRKLMQKPSGSPPRLGALPQPGWPHRLFNRSPGNVPDRPAWDEVADAVLGGLTAGHTVEINGLATFYPDRAHGFRFRAHTKPKVFVAYVVEDDRESANRLYDALSHAGFSPWMDTHKLLPGQNWWRAIEIAIGSADIVAAYLCSHSVDKRGAFQAEIRYAFDGTRRVPLDDIFLVPVRFDACRLPRSIQREWQYLDLFPDGDPGFNRLASAIRQEMNRRRAALHV